MLRYPGIQIQHYFYEIISKIMYLITHKSQYPRSKKFSSTTLRSQTVLWKKHCLGIGKEHRVWNLKVSISMKEKQGFILCLESHIVRYVSNTDSSIQYGSNKEILGNETMEPMLAVWELKVY